MHFLGGGPKNVPVALQWYFEIILSTCNNMCRLSNDVKRTTKQLPVKFRHNNNNSNNNGAAREAVKLSCFWMLHWNPKLIKCKKMLLDASGPQCGGRIDGHLSGHMSKVLLERFKIADFGSNVAHKRWCHAKGWAKKTPVSYINVNKKEFFFPWRVKA